MKNAFAHTLFIFCLLLGSVSCGGDAAKSDENQKNQHDADTSATDTINDSDTLTIDTSEVINMADTIKLEVKKESAIEKAAAGSEGQAEAAKAKFKTYNLKEHGFNLSISLPQGTQIALNDFDEAVLSFGDDFVLEIGENYDGSISEIKSKFKGNVHNQMLGYVIEDEKGFARKIKSNGVISHNLFYTVNDGQMDLMVKSPMGQAYSQSEILEMWKACQTIKVLP